VLVAVKDLERLEETLVIKRDADTMRRLAESDAEFTRGGEVGLTGPERGPCPFYAPIEAGAL
jgi:PHD/YefM family antitoxin component YafN of YafNO toxin-antitoxin module